jgi:hypothetical protein
MIKSSPNYCIFQNKGCPNETPKRGEDFSYSVWYSPKLTSDQENEVFEIVVDAVISLTFFRERDILDEK